MLKAELMSKEELLQAINECKGRTAEFNSEKYGFSYTTAISEAKKRGYTDAWHDPADFGTTPTEKKVSPEQTNTSVTLYLSSTDDTKRQTILMSQSVFDRYKDKLGGLKGASALVDFAITRLLDEIEKGEIEVKVKI